MSKGDKIRDTKTLNLSRYIVLFQVFVDVSYFSPCMINCPATITFAAGWRNTACWLVNLLGVDLIWQHLLRDKLWVRWKMSNKAKIYCSKWTSALIFTTPFFNPQQIFLLLQVDHARWKTRHINPKLDTKQCCMTSWGVLYLVFRRLKMQSKHCLLLLLLKLVYYSFVNSMFMCVWVYQIWPAPRITQPHLFIRNDLYFMPCTVHTLLCANNFDDIRSIPWHGDLCCSLQLQLLQHLASFT